MDRIHEKPLQFDPRNVNSVRLGCQSAPPDTRRAYEQDPGTPYTWNSVKVLDARIKSELGGGRETTEDRIGSHALHGTNRSPATTDEMALKFLYTSSTQRMFESVPWDSMLHPRRWKPVSSMDQRVVFWSNKPQHNKQTVSVQQHAKPLQLSTNVSQLNSRNSVPRDGISMKLYSMQLGGRTGTVDDVSREHHQDRSFGAERSFLDGHSNTSHRPYIPGYAGHQAYFSVRPNTTNGEFKTLNRLLAR